jgi:hypothetical protein
MAQRIKGQETVIGFTNPDGDQEGLEDILDFEAELDMEILEEKYLGKTSNDYDDIFNGVSGQVQLHMRTVDYFRFQERIQERAERRTAADGTFSATAAFNFPSGIRVRITFEDLFFGPSPIKVGGRSEYVSGTIAWKCSRIRRVF